MPYKAPPKCVQCGTSESKLWRNLDLGTFCFECYEKNEAGGDIAETVKNEDKDKDKEVLQPPESEGGTAQKGKKATRASRASKVSSKDTKGRSRRCEY